MSQTSFVLSLAMLSFVLTVIWGPPLLRILRHYKIGKIIRVDEPGHHNVKMGTPTMGGVLFILPVLLLTILLNAAAFIGLDVIGKSVLVPLIVMIGYAALGAIDDWEGVRGKRGHAAASCFRTVSISSRWSTGTRSSSACASAGSDAKPSVPLTGVRSSFRIAIS